MGKKKKHVKPQVSPRLPPSDLLVGGPSLVPADRHTEQQTLAVDPVNSISSAASVGALRPPRLALAGVPSPDPVTLSALAVNRGTESHASVAPPGASSSAGLPPSPLHQSLPSSSSGSRKPSWKDLVKGSKSKMQKKGDPYVLESGETCVQIPNTVIQKTAHRWTDFLIGQFHGNAPPPGLFHAIVNGIWSPRLKNISVSKLSPKAYLIKISCPITRKKVLDQGMWHIEKQTMFVAKWQPGFLPEVPALTSAPVWLDFHNVPPQFYSEEGLEYIAGLLGDPLFLHPMTANMTNLEIARVYTVIDPTKPLPEAVNVCFESGHTHRIPVSCQWLPPLCDHCNEIGHTLKRCPTAPITCTDCKSTGHSSLLCPRKKKVTKVPPAESNPTQRPKDAALRVGLQAQTVASAPPPPTSETPAPCAEDDHQHGRISTAIVQKEHAPTSSMIRSRRKLPTYFTTSGPAVFSSEPEVFSSETESSYNYSDEDEFPPLSDRYRKVIAQRDNNAIKLRK